MDLRYPLRSLIPSLDADVLEVLASVHVGLGASQITRRSARGTRPGITAVLDRLVRHGLVIAEPANQGFLYRLNRSHLLIPPLLAAIDARSTLISKLKVAAHAAAPAAVHSSVFGSLARDEATPESDIDVLLVASTERELRQWDDGLASLRAQAESWTGNRCQTIAISTSHLRRLRNASEPIVKGWLADAVLLNGSPLAKLLTGRANRRS